MSANRVLAIIVAALVAWGAILALGDYLNYDSSGRWGLWRVLVILGCVGGFLGFWMLMLRSRARRRGRRH